MSKEKSLSIVIPTRNNHYLISQQLKCFLDWPSLNDLEIIIHDNSDLRFEDKTLLSKFENSCLKYIHYPQSMTMKENLEKGFLNCSGKYVTVIGDDDLVTPKILDDLAQLEREELDGCYYPNISSFLWPKVNSFWFRDNNNGTFIESKKRKKLYVNVKKNLKKIMHMGGTEYLEFLPSVYHGVIKRRLLQKIYDDIGTLFPGPSPDISNAVLNAVYGNKFFTSNNSSIISGARLGSGSAEGYMKKHHGNFEERKNVFGDKKINEQIPKFFCNKTIWSQSVDETLRAINTKNLNINYDYLHASCLIFHPKYFLEVITSIIKNRLNLFNVSFFCIVIFFRRLNVFYQNIFLRIFGFNRYYKVSRGYNDLYSLSKKVF